MKICYVDHKFAPDAQTLIDTCNGIIDDYRAQGYTLTLRQLYYRLVAAALIENTDHSYKRIGSIINDARLAGLIDWEAIEDRTRFVRSLAHWSSPSAIVRGCAEQFRMDMWSDQPTRVEVWVEKDALVGVFEPVCNELDLPLLSCRGYVSQSEMWGAGQRLRRHCGNDQEVVVLHFGDHDPSGKDMSRDIQDRLDLFLEGDSVEVHRIALTMAQVEEVQPPPNPAKITDSRARGYIEEFGSESWELDALNPEYLSRLVREHAAEYIDAKKWKARAAIIKMGRSQLSKVADSLEARP